MGEVVDVAAFFVFVFFLLFQNFFCFSAWIKGFVGYLA